MNRAVDRFKAISQNKKDLQEKSQLKICARGLGAQTAEGEPRFSG